MKRIYAAIAFLLVIVSTSLFTIKQCYAFCECGSWSS